MSSKRNENGGTAVMEQPEATSTAPVTSNRTLVFHSVHPSNRVSYKIPGVPGNVVIFNTMFRDGIAPPTITVDCELALPQPKVDKSAEKAAKAAERATKAAERLAVQQAKAAERQAKADAALQRAKDALAKAGSAPASA